MRPLWKTAIDREWLPRIGPEATHQLVVAARLFWLRIILAIGSVGYGIFGRIGGPFPYAPSTLKIVVGVTLAVCLGAGLVYSIFGRDRCVKKALKLAASHARSSGYPRLIRFHDDALSDPVRFDQIMTTIPKGG
jgi:hypothetical protein